MLRRSRRVEPAVVWMPPEVERELEREADRCAPLETGGVLLGYEDTEARGQLQLVTPVGPGPKAVHRRHRFQPDPVWQRDRIAAERGALPGVRKRRHLPRRLALAPTRLRHAEPIGPEDRTANRPLPRGSRSPSAHAHPVGRPGHLGAPRLPLQASSTAACRLVARGNARWGLIEVLARGKIAAPARQVESYPELPSVRAPPVKDHQRTWAVAALVYLQRLENLEHVLVDALGPIIGAEEIGKLERNAGLQLGRGIGADMGGMVKVKDP